MKNRRNILILLTFSVLLQAAPAAAYEAKFTHRWIARVAVDHLLRTHPGVYDQLKLFREDVVDGVEHEDDIFVDGDTDPLTLRVMRHFHRPVDESGLFMFEQTFPNSLQWGTMPRSDNNWGWDDALEQYQYGNYAEAFFAIGHVIHLIQDLTVPAHTHLDIHGPPDGDDYESYCFKQMVSEYVSTLAVPAVDTPIPAFATLEEAWFATSSASYWRNMYTGHLDDATKEVSGEVALMFGDLGWSWFKENWTIGTPSVGALGADFFEDQSGWFYFKNSEHPAAYDRANYSGAFNPNPEIALNTADNSMTANFARDLVPVAILHSSAVLKMFMDKAVALEPLEPPTRVKRERPSQGCQAAPVDMAGWLAVFSVFLAWRRRLFPATGNRR